MSADSSAETEAPGRNATVVRFRQGRGMFVAALGLCVFAGLFLWYILDPSIRYGPDRIGSAWLYFLVFGPVSFVLLVGVGLVLLKPVRLHVDERGLWWEHGSVFNLVAWEELNALQERKAVPRKSDDSGKTTQEAKPGGLRLFPVDCDRFLLSNPTFGDKEIDVGEAHRGQEPVSYLWPLPRTGVARRILKVVERHRPDLVR